VKPNPVEKSANNKKKSPVEIYYARMTIKSYKISSGDYYVISARGSGWNHSKGMV
jgi:hypothetical protein